MISAAKYSAHTEPLFKTQDKDKTKTKIFIQFIP